METQLFTIGEMNAAGFWTALLAGTMLSLLLCLPRVRKAGVPARTFGLFSVLGIVLGVMLSHIGYCLMRLDYVLYEAGALTFLAFWEGGFMLYGGMLSVVLAAFAACGFHKKPALTLLDAAAPAAGVLIAAVRIAEGFAGQGYGEYIFDENLFCTFPFAAFDPLFETWAWLVFVPEALWALVCGILVLLFCKNTREGDGALLFAGLYAAAQIVFESLRRDEFLRWGFVRCSQLISAAVILLVLLIWHLRSGKGHLLRKVLCWAGFAALVTSVILLEFATEKRIPFLTFLEIEGCYAAMGCCSALFILCLFGMRTAQTTQTVRRKPSC